MLLKIKKIIISIFLILGSFWVIGYWLHSSNVFAESTSTPAAEKPKDSNDGIQWLLETMQSFLKIFYVILWPVLAIAWASLDNSLIYWSVFHLDRPLFMFWNMMKNFANYAMGFMFIFSVLTYFFKQDDKFKPLNLIKKLLIWWVLIQASWWMVWALIDLSTVATYWLWAMPLNMLKNDKLIGESPVIFDDTIINLNDWGEKWVSKWVQTRVSWNQKAVSCITKKDWDKTIIDQEATKKLVNDTKDRTWKTSSTTVSWQAEVSDAVCSYQNWIININCGDLSPDKISECKPSGSYDKVITLWNLVEKSKWMTWPLYALYGSILNFGSIPMTANNKSLWTESMITLMKCLMGLALMIPLMTLAIVLIIRVVILWIFIWFSPLIVLAAVFDNFGALKKVNEWKYWLKKIISLIFVPVSAVFAISLSLIFLSLLANSIEKPESKSNGKATRLESALDISIKDWCVTFVWWEFWKMCISTSDKSFWLDPMLNIFSWLIMNFLWIWLMWAIVFAAMKTWWVTDWVVNWIQKFGWEILKSTPIVPTPFGRMSVGWLSSATSTLWHQIPSKLVEQQMSEKIQPLVEQFGHMIGQTKRQHESEFTNYGKDSAYKWWSKSLVEEIKKSSNQPGARLSSYDQLPKAVSNIMWKDWYNNKDYKNVDEMYKDPDFISWADKNWLPIEELAKIYSNVWNDVTQKKDDEYAMWLLSNSIRDKSEYRYETSWDPKVSYYRKWDMVVSFKWDKFEKWYYVWEKPKDKNSLEGLKWLISELWESTAKNSLNIKILNEYAGLDWKIYEFKRKSEKDYEITEKPKK